MRGALMGALLGLAACHAPAAPAGPLRVVSLHDVTTEIAVALGAKARLVGVAEPVEVPPEVAGALAGLPRVEGAESILALHPNLVLGMEVVARRSPELLALLRARGIAVWLGRPTTLDEVLAMTLELGARLQVRTAGPLVSRLRAGMAELPSGRARRVFVYDCCDPAFTAGRTAVLTDVIRRAGGQNVFADVDADWTRVSWEEVVARRPELIVVHDYAYEGQADVDGKRARLATLRALAGVPVLVLPLGLSLGGLRSFEGLVRLRAALGGPG
jgi:iron complex transport system substrate-binding protein